MSTKDGHGLGVQDPRASLDGCASLFRVLHSVRRFWRNLEKHACLGRPDVDVPHDPATSQIAPIQLLRAPCLHFFRRVLKLAASHVAVRWSDHALGPTRHGNPTGSEALAACQILSGPTWQAQKRAYEELDMAAHASPGASSEAGCMSG